MARPKKELVERLRAKIVAVQFIECIGCARTGYAMARWLENNQKIETSSLADKIWSRFLNGSVPSAPNLSLIFSVMPDLELLFNHSVWRLLSLSCDRSECMTVLESYNYDGREYWVHWFNKVDALNSVDQFTVYLAMVIQSGRNTMVLDRLICAYSATVIELGLHEFELNIRNLLLAKLDQIEWNGVFFFKNTLLRNFWFWILIHDECLRCGGDQPSTWKAWQKSVLRLTWADREELNVYLWRNKNHDDNGRSLQQKKLYMNLRRRIGNLIKKDQLSQETCKEL